MYGEFLVEEYENPHKGSAISMEYITADTQKASKADLVLLARADRNEPAVWRAKGYRVLFAGRTIGHMGLCMLVHPSIPLLQIDMNAVRGILQGRIKSWKHFAGPDKPIRVIREAWASGGLHEFLGSRQMVGRSVTGRNVFNKISVSVGNDPCAIGFVNAKQYVPDTGLRVVRVFSAPKENESYLFSDGMWILSRRDAPPEVGALAEYLRDRLAEGYSIAGGWVVMLPEGKAPVKVWPKPGELAAPENIAGGVAVLPIEPQAPYFLLLKAEHVARYEDRIVEALAADESLTLVDRQELNHVLKEKQLTLLGRKAPSRLPKAILAADVLVDSIIATEDHRTYLFVRAIHAATGSVLGQLQLPIDPARPEGFSPPLTQRVAEWWPGVLANLQRARTLPVVAVRGVYPSRAAWRQGNRLREAMTEAIAGESQCFLAEYRISMSTQTEMLMRMMGLSLAKGGLLNAAADYVLEARMSSDRQAELRIVRAADQKVLQRSTVTAGSFDSLLSIVRRWVKQCANLYTRKPHGFPVAETRDADDWARQQARGEFKAAEGLYKKHKNLLHGLPSYPPDKITDSHIMREEVIRRFLLAAQIDPTYELAAFRAVLILSEWDWPSYESAKAIATTASRYVETFPNSRRGGHPLIRAIYAFRYLAGLCDKAAEGELNGVPPSLDTERYGILYRGKAIEYYRLFAERQIKDPNLNNGNWMSPQCITEHYQHYVAMSLGHTKATEDRIAETIDEWAQLYDRYPETFPPSALLRLYVLAIQKKNKTGVKYFRELVCEHPNPNDKFWTFFKRSTLFTAVRKIDCQLAGKARDWLAGKSSVDELLERGSDR